MERRLLYCLNVLSATTPFGFNRTCSVPLPPPQRKDVRTSVLPLSYHSDSHLRSRYLVETCLDGVVFNSAITPSTRATHIIVSSKSQGTWFGISPTTYDTFYREWCPVEASRRRWLRCAANGLGNPAKPGRPLAGWKHHMVSSGGRLGGPDPLCSEWLLPMSLRVRLNLNKAHHFLCSI